MVCASAESDTNSAASPQANASAAVIVVVVVLPMRRLNPACGKLHRRTAKRIRRAGCASRVALDPMRFISNAAGPGHGSVKKLRNQLGLVAQTLLMAILLHALAALVLVDLGFTSLFQ